MSRIYNLNDTGLDLENIIGYGLPRAGEKGGKNIKVYDKNTKNKSALCFETGTMLTWGAHEVLDQNKQPTGKYSMSIQYPTEEYTNPEMEQGYENIKKLQDKIYADALKNSKQWFGKEYTNMEVVHALIYPMLKYPKIKGTEEYDYSKRPTLNIKLPYYNNVWGCELYDQRGNPLFPNEDDSITPLDLIPEYTRSNNVIQCTGIWVTSGKLSFTWKLVQAVIQDSEPTLKGKCHLSVDASQSSSSNAESSQTNSPVVEPTKVGVEVTEDTDDENEVVDNVVDEVESETEEITDQLDEVENVNVKTEPVVEKKKRKTKSKS